ncbi:MAG: hypothetical protein WDW38_010594 [Sanguina aurantia]
MALHRQRESKLYESSTLARQLSEAQGRVETERGAMQRSRGIWKEHLTEQSAYLQQLQAKVQARTAAACTGHPATACAHTTTTTTSPASTPGRGQGASIAVPVTGTGAAACGDGSGVHAHSTGGVHAGQVAVGVGAEASPPTAAEAGDAAPSHTATSHAGNAALDAAAVCDMECDAVTAGSHSLASDSPAGGSGCEQPAAAITATDGTSPAAALEVGLLATAGGGDAEVDFIPMSSV